MHEKLYQLADCITVEKKKISVAHLPPSSYTFSNIFRSIVSFTAGWDSEDLDFLHY